MKHSPDLELIYEPGTEEFYNAYTINDVAIAGMLSRKGSREVPDLRVRFQPTSDRLATHYFSAPDEGDPAEVTMNIYDRRIPSRQFLSFCLLHELGHFDDFLQRNGEPRLPRYYDEEHLENLQKKSRCVGPALTGIGAVAMFGVDQVTHNPLITGPVEAGGIATYAMGLYYWIHRNPKTAFSIQWMTDPGELKAHKFALRHITTPVIQPRQQ